MTSVAKALGIDLNSTLGAAFIGLVVSAVYVFLPLYLLKLIVPFVSFYGITVVQTIGYFEHCSRDPKYLKIVVCAVPFYVYETTDNTCIGRNFVVRFPRVNE